MLLRIQKKRKKLAKVRREVDGSGQILSPEKKETLKRKQRKKNDGEAQISYRWRGKEKICWGKEGGSDDVPEIGDMSMKLLGLDRWTWFEGVRQ
jgi:hypothetical protein